MKNLLVLMLALLPLTSLTFAQEKQRASPHETVKGKNISVTYGRPYKKGREIFGGLEAYGKVWRAGADEATQVTFDKDCTFGGKPLKAGTYTLFVIPEKREWTIILNSKLGEWGAFGYEKIKNQDVLKVKVPARQTNGVTEQFTIGVPGEGITMQWDKTSVLIPVAFK